MMGEEEGELSLLTAAANRKAMSGTATWLCVEMADGLQAGLSGSLKKEGYYWQRIGAYSLTILCLYASSVCHHDGCFRCRHHGRGTSALEKACFQEDWAAERPKATTPYYAKSRLPALPLAKHQGHSNPSKEYRKRACSQARVLLSRERAQKQGSLRWPLSIGSTNWDIGTYTSGHALQCNAQAVR